MSIPKRHRPGTPSTSPESLQQSTENPTGKPGILVWPCRSQKPKYAERLAQESELRWVKPASEAPGWLRESFQRTRPKSSSLWAFTTDSRGRIVRAFSADERSIAAYAELQRNGYGTCPIEAVWPPSIAPGQPAEPAHLYLLALQEVGQ